MVLAQDSNRTTFFKVFCVQKLPTERKKMSGKATATGKGRTAIRQVLQNARSKFNNIKARRGIAGYSKGYARVRKWKKNPQHWTLTYAIFYQVKTCTIFFSLPLPCALPRAANHFSLPGTPHPPHRKKSPGKAARGYHLSCEAQDREIAQVWEVKLQKTTGC